MSENPSPSPSPPLSLPEKNFVSFAALDLMFGFVGVHAHVITDPEDVAKACDESVHAQAEDLQLALWTRGYRLTHLLVTPR